ncbi:MAG TPA: hypothetical protein PK733_06895 [Clostridiales bacterium]|nr:hypothetical protein [Clostridiales bacterium]
MAIKKGLLIGLIIAAVILVILAAGIGTVLSIHNSTYDCSFVYVQPEDLVKEIATKHTYYESDSKTVEIELNQDLINSLIKDNFENLDIALPDKFSINEILFNTKDQRLYINGKYGSLNVPLSAKLDINLTEDGIDITASQLNLGNKKAPGLITNQIPADALSYSLKYADFDLPDIFKVKDVQFGSGIVKAYIELLPDKIKEMAMDYRNQALDQIDTFKAGQSEFISNFITRILDSTALLSDVKVNEFVDFVLNHGELLNSAIQFALVDDLSDYSEQFNIAQKAIADWAAPLEAVKYYGSIEETKDKILYDQKLKDLVSWFIPSEKINEYVGTVEEYYGMYEEILDMKDELESTFASLSFSTDSIEETVASLQNKIFRNSRLINLVSDYIPAGTFGDIADTIDEYVGLYNEYMGLLDDTMNNVALTAGKIDVESINEITNTIMDYANQAGDVRELIVDALSSVDTQLVKDLVHFVEFGGKFGQDFIATIDPDNYSIFREYVDNLSEIQADTIDFYKNFDTSVFVNNATTIKEIGDFSTEVVTLLRNKDVENAIDVLMNKNFNDYQFEVPEFSDYEMQFEIVVE